MARPLLRVDELTLDTPLPRIVKVRVVESNEVIGFPGPFGPNQMKLCMVRQWDDEGSLPMQVTLYGRYVSRHQALFVKDAVLELSGFRIREPTTRVQQHQKYVLIGQPFASVTAFDVIPHGEEQSVPSAAAAAAAIAASAVNSAALPPQASHASQVSVAGKKHARQAADEDIADEHPLCCQICFMSKVRQVTVPCGHTACNGCTDKMYANAKRLCHTCRTVVTSTVTMFIAS